MKYKIASFVEKFIANGSLRRRVIQVLEKIPAEVVEDLMRDRKFSMAVSAGRWDTQQSFQIASPGVGREGSRLIVLKESLGKAPEPVANYVIAHEVAHAYLRNGGRTPGEDPEVAADALAAEWGFPRPGFSPRN